MTNLRSSGHDFQSPPVYETALAVQFEELVSFRTVHFGLFYESVASRFPVAEDQPRAEPIVETFPIVPRQLTLNLVQKNAGPERVWFRDEVDGAVLLQVQPDRFGLNWRRTSDDAEDPKFRQNGPRFLEEFGKFERFCEQQFLGKLHPNLCEVIYVNHIFPLADESALECMERVLSGVTLKLDNGLPMPELAAFNRVYPLGDGKGRLYAEAAVGRHQEKGNFVLLKITARIVHRDGDDVAANIQLAHDAVVNGFVAITTPDAKSKLWGQTQ